MIHYSQEERHTDSHSYGNRRHVFRAFTDDEFEIPDTLCVKRRFNAQEVTLVLSGTQRLLGDHCAQISHRKFMWFSQAKLPDSLVLELDGGICIWPRAI